MLGTETLIIVFAVIFLFRHLLRQKWSVFKQYGIPHDTPSIFRFGHATNMVGKKDVAAYQIECKEKFGKVWGYYLWTEPRIVVHDPEMLREIMIKRFHVDFPNRRNVPPSLADGVRAGLVFATGNQWKRIRSTLTPAFSSGKIKKMSDIMIRCINKAMEPFTNKQQSGKDEIVFTEFFSELSLDIICATAFGTELHSKETDKRKLTLSQRASLLSDTASPSLVGLISLLYPSLGRLLLFGSARRTHMMNINKFCVAVISDRLTSSNNPVDLMQLMIDAKVSEPSHISDGHKGITGTEIAQNALTMLLAGRNTVSNAMTTLAYNLAMHPDIQTKLQMEIDAVYKEMGSLDWEAVNQMKYLDMCIAESIRLYCPFARTARQASRDVVIGGLTIKRNWFVEIPIQALSRDPEFWPDPLQFVPDRFQDKTAIDPMVFQPFGSGPRVCIGQRFARIEMKLTFSRLLQQYTLVPSSETPKPPLDLSYSFSTQPVHPIKLKVVPRDGSSSFSK